MRITPYFMLSLLPVMILCLPSSTGTFSTMLIAFGIGISIDIFAEGLYGINAAAILPVAFTRKTILRLIFGQELIDRNECISLKKHGVIKVSAAILIAQLLFLCVYIMLDGAGTRPFLFNLTRLSVSMLLTLPISLIASHMLNFNEH